MLFLSVPIFMFLVASSSAKRWGIVNGQPSVEAEFPFMVSLRSELGSHLCGATLITNQWILTAAHCASLNSSTILNVQYGVTQISPLGPNIGKIDKIIIHENYNPMKSFNNDIALIRLKHPVLFTNKVRRVKLPRRFSEVPENTPITIMGWGFEQTIGRVQNDLQKANILTYSNEKCSEIHFSTIFPSQLCAGVPEGGKGQCSGDSGGPLIKDGVQLGIISWSTKPCVMPPYPGIFTKVSHFIDWILTNIEN